jgi:hypothetical protein
VSEVKVNAYRTNTTTHRAVIKGSDLEQLIATHVATAAGVDINHDAVRAQCHITSRMGNYGSETEAVVTITVDNERFDGVAEVES